MKTWQQFNEDANSYAKDKKAYEKQTASKRKLDARRKALKTRMASLAKKFAQKSKAKKHKTEIKDEAFIGSGVELVAPIIIGEGATVGAGSTLTKDAEDEKLTVERSSQSTIENWKRPKK